jgi:uncharacterized Zn-binding protein involved in type VI secretion
MSGNVLHAGATVTCPHGGTATARPAQSAVRVDGRECASLADLWTVTGCPFTVNGKPQPCTAVRWTGASACVTVDGSPVLLQGSPAQCHSAEQVPQGPHTVSVIQQGVTAR